MRNNIFKILAIFIIGTIGGIFADQILLPYFIERPLFHQYRLEQAPVNVIREETIIIQENEALTKAVDKVQKSVVAIKTTRSNQTILRGSGIIISSDGLVLTLAELVPPSSNFSLFFNGDNVPFQIEKRDLDNNLALIRVEKENLPTIGFSNISELKIGQRVFLVGAVFSGSTMEKMANEGIVKFFGKDFIRTSIVESNILSGSPLFDIEGNILGINTIDAGGGVTAIPISIIRQFIGL